MKVLIIKGSNAYLPEAFAYQDFLTSKNIEVMIDTNYDNVNEYDICISFMGFIPFWDRRYRDSKAIHIHEYHSLSTSSFPYLKDFVKCKFNKKPKARIFLNNVVREKINFSDNIPYICRDMGVDKMIFEVNNKNALFDIIYCGSIQGRVGLIEEILRLARLGLSILVVGKVDKLNSIKLQHNKIKLIGSVSRQELPKYYASAKYGLNFTPDIYPFNFQTSTKVLEYCAAGLGIISNEYEWILKFQRDRNANILYSHKIKSNKDVHSFGFITPDVSDLEWFNLLERAAFDTFLIEMLGV